MFQLIERRPVTATLVVICVLAIVMFILNSLNPSNDPKGLGDAPVGSTHEAPRQVWLSPDNFMNIGAFCIGVNGVYVHTRSASPIVIPNDKNCLPGGILYSAVLSISADTPEGSPEN